MPPETASAPAVDPIVGHRSWLSRILLDPWNRVIRTRGVPTLHYLMKTESHTFAFSVAANAILSFFPFMVLLMWLIRNVFHSQTMFNVVVDLLKDHLPAGQDFVITNLTYLVKTRQRVKMNNFFMKILPHPKPLNLKTSEKGQ